MPGDFSYMIKSDLLSNTEFNTLTSKIIKVDSRFMVCVMLVAKGAY